MLPLIICGVLISITSHVECVTQRTPQNVPLNYEHFPEANGKFKLHKQPADWLTAFVTCYNEGAILASPLDEEVRGAMQTIMLNYGDSSSFFIGANAKYTSGVYVSVEGVPITKMPAGDMYEVLDKQQGECLSMSSESIKVVSCSIALPFLCYKPDSECGTTDKQYKFEPSTGSCYKLHKELKSWRDANTACISEGGYLTILNNEPEMQVVVSMMPESTGSWPHERGWQGMYIGLHDWTHKKTWLTNEARPLTKLFHNWDSTQPDSPGQANCAVINRHKKLDNIWCHYLAPFVCEKDPKNVMNNEEQPDPIGMSRPL